MKEGTSQESIDAMLQSFRDLAASMDPDSMFQLTAGDAFLQSLRYLLPTIVLGLLNLSAPSILGLIKCTTFTLCALGLN